MAMVQPESRQSEQRDYWWLKLVLFNADCEQHSPLAQHISTHSHPSLVSHFTEFSAEVPLAGFGRSGSMALRKNKFGQSERLDEAVARL